MAMFIALLRAINVGKRQVPMKDLKALAEKIGFEEVQTYIASGNLVFAAEGKAEAIEAKLEAALAERFGFKVDVVARGAREWAKILAANPLAEQSKAEPNRVMLLLSKAKPAADAAARIAAAGQADEVVKAAGGALWVHYPAGQGTSKITPVLVDKACGSPTTARNVRTLEKLAEMAGVG
jgi:uncharacterized protein (DUF1697 family)